MAQKINKISDTELTKNGVSSLADRPNQTSTYGTGGLSAQELKVRFDTLSRILNGKLNDIIDILASETATKYIGVDRKFNKDSLYDLLSDISSGDLGDSLYVDTSSGEQIPLNTVVQMIERRISELEENGGSGGGGSYGTVDSSLSETSTNPVQNKVVTTALNALAGKQDKLQAGDGIVINGNVISATGASGGGTPITIDGSLSETSTNPVQNKVITEEVRNITNNYLGKTEARTTYLSIENAAKEYVPVNDFRKKYIDLSQYVSGGVVSHYLFNEKLYDLASQGYGGQDRVDIYFYQSDPTSHFDFDGNITWQSNCNYHYLNRIDNKANRNQTLYLRDIINCRFDGFRVYFMEEGTFPIDIENCSNIEFFDCYVENAYATAVRIANSDSILFNDCEILGGSYKNATQQIVCYIEDSDVQNFTNWILFENCSIKQALKNSTIPLISCLGVYNPTSLLTVIHCVTNDFDEVVPENIAYGSGIVRVFNASQKPLTSGKGISIANNSISISLPFNASGADGQGLTSNSSTPSGLRLPSSGIYLIQALPGPGAIICVDASAPSLSNLTPFYDAYTGAGSGHGEIIRHYLWTDSNLYLYHSIVSADGALTYQATNVAYTRIG